MVGPGKVLKLAMAVDGVMKLVIIVLVTTGKGIVRPGWNAICIINIIFHIETTY